jgi:60 kDa SS-A/Ro ribonucleoprotein
MANTQVFKTSRGGRVVPANTINEAGGRAYKLTSEQALAQYALTGTISNIYYVDAETQLDRVLALTREVSPEFIAQLAIYASQEGFMKDVPALLVASLAASRSEYLEPAFRAVITNGKMLRNFVQIVRSGVTGRKSFGSRPRRLIRHWFDDHNPEWIFRNSIGQTPSLGDVIKMVHTKPVTAARKNLYAYLIGKPWEGEIDQSIISYETLKRGGDSKTALSLPFQMLASLPLTEAQWREVATHTSWQTLRMNLNAFARHGVFKDKELVALLASRLANYGEVRRSKVFPYQLLAAYQNAGAEVPTLLKNALQSALEIATENVPVFEGSVAVGLDVSGSMASPVTGTRGKVQASKVRCVDVAALFTATVLRKNPLTLPLPFDTSVHRAHVNPMDSIMTIASQLARYGGGGTNCALPFEHLVKQKEQVDAVILVSDNEGWVNNGGPLGYYGTSAAEAWARLKVQNPKAKLVCINIQPGSTTQVLSTPDVLNIGGFSDQVFSVVSMFLRGELKPDSLVERVKQVKLQ